MRELQAIDRRAKIPDCLRVVPSAGLGMSLAGGGLAGRTLLAGTFKGSKRKRLAAKYSMPALTIAFVEFGLEHRRSRLRV